MDEIIYDYGNQGILRNAGSWQSETDEHREANVTAANVVPASRYTTPYGVVYYPIRPVIGGLRDPAHDPLLYVRQNTPSPVETAYALQTASTTSSANSVRFTQQCEDERHQHRNNGTSLVGNTSQTPGIQGQYCLALPAHESVRSREPSEGGSLTSPADQTHRREYREIGRAPAAVSATQRIQNVMRNAGLSSGVRPLLPAAPTSTFTDYMRARPIQSERNQEAVVTPSRSSRSSAPYRCDYPGCDTESNTPSALKQHQRYHLDESERPLACSWAGCMRRFNFPREIKRHEAKHKGKKHLCPICKRRLSRGDNLARHMCIVHKLRCPICGMRSSHGRDLIRHLRANHGQTGSQGSRESSEASLSSPLTSSAEDEVDMPRRTQRQTNASAQQRPLQPRLSTRTPDEAVRVPENGDMSQDPTFTRVMPSRPSPNLVSLRGSATSPHQAYNSLVDDQMLPLTPMPFMTQPSFGPQTGQLGEHSSRRSYYPYFGGIDPAQQYYPASPSN